MYGSQRNDSSLEIETGPIGQLTGHLTEHSEHNRLLVDGHEETGSLKAMTKCTKHWRTFTLIVATLILSGAVGFFLHPALKSDSSTKASPSEADNLSEDVQAEVFFKLLRNFLNRPQSCCDFQCPPGYDNLGGTTECGDRLGTLPGDYSPCDASVCCEETPSLDEVFASGDEIEIFGDRLYERDFLFQNTGGAVGSIFAGARIQCRVTPNDIISTSEDTNEKRWCCADAGADSYIGSNLAPSGSPTTGNSVGTIFCYNEKTIWGAAIGTLNTGDQYESTFSTASFSSASLTVLSKDCEGNLYLNNAVRPSPPSYPGYN